MPTTINKIIKFGKKSHPEVARFSHDGQFLVSGSVDGFVEVWDYDTGKLMKDLKYQAEDDFMMHEDTVLCCAFSGDSELLATGASNGAIKVWKIRTGSCVRKFMSAHTGGATSVEFARDGTQLLSGSFDSTVKIHGLKSGRALKEFRGHKSYVNCAVYSEDGAQIYSCSSDGTLKVWDAKTTDCLRTIKPSLKVTSQQNEEELSSQAAVALIGITRLTRQMDRLVVCTQSKYIYLISTSGQVIQSYVAGGDIQSYAVSPKGNFIYAVAEDKNSPTMYCFNLETAKVEHVMKLHKKDVLGICHHPHRNVFVSYSNDGSMKLWKP